MFNPYYLYIYGFFLSIIIYQLGWSILFPKITIEMYIFLLFTLICAFFLGKFTESKKIISFYKVRKIENTWLVIIFIFFGYLLEFLYSKNIPFLSLVVNNYNNVYKEFGIPIFHVFLVTFNSFVSIYIFHIFLSNKNRKYMILFLLLLIPPLLIVNRGMIVMILISCGFLFLIKIKTLTIKQIVNIVLILLVGLYLFGLFGNLRVNDSYGRDSDIFDTTVLFSVGGASEEFKDSPIPDPFFWSYIYIASPLANFQETTNEFTNNKITFSNTIQFINSEIFPDFISKRINDLMGWNYPTISKISPELTVGTIYARAYAQLGWLGSLLIYLFLIVSSLFYMFLLRNFNKDYYLTGIAILATLFLMSTFSNMISFSGLSFQLIYPIALTYFPIFRKRITK